MSLQMNEQAGGKVLELHATGKLEVKDYERFTPEAERLIKLFGKIRVLLVLSDFHGWTAGAMWDDLKFDVKHFNDIERVAVVGEKKWQHGMTTFCKPFTTAKVRYFEHDHVDEARTWIAEGIGEASLSS